MDLFGTKKLKQQIAALEDEKTQLQEHVQELERKLEKADRRKKKAVTAKQEAEKKINRLEDRIHGLEGKLTDTDDKNTEHHTTSLTIPGVEAVLDNLSNLSFGKSNAITVYANGEQPAATFVDPHIAGLELTLPLPIESSTYRSSSFTVQPLQDMLHARYLFLHLSDGGSGIAVIEDGTVQEHETIKADIKAKHGKGGYSQKRFQRIREQQIQEHVEAVIDVYNGFSNSGYEQFIVTGNEHLIDTAADRLDDHIQCSSNVRKIREKEQLQDSFNTALGCTLRQLTPDERDKILAT